MNHPIIDVQGIQRVYKDSRQGTSYTAVDDSTFQVHRGEIFGLLGTNGAGKTSTLEIVEGLAQPAEGSVRIHGLDPYQDRTQLRPHMGIMLQSGGLPPLLTVRETLTMWAGTLSHPLPVDEVAEAVELKHRMDIKVGALSGGEQRRLDLGCALAGNPSVLFLDEPTTGLDPESRSHTWQLLLSLKKRGVTMILTTHYLEEAEYLCDRIAIMHQSKIVREGTVQELVAGETSRLQFHSPQPAPDIFTGSCIRDGTKHTVSTRDLIGDTHTALNWAQIQGINLSNFSAQSASLKTVFLSLSQSTPEL